MGALSLVSFFFTLSILQVELSMNTDVRYDFTSNNVWLPMPDGIRLSASLAIPIARTENEKFPVLLEYKPYRKDDSFYNFNQPQVAYLARRGYIVSEKHLHDYPLTIS